MYVFKIKLDDATEDFVTLDSGAGISVWPKGRKAGKSVLGPKKKGIRMVAANDTEIKHYGHRRVGFQGVKTDKSVFSGRA